MQVTHWEIEAMHAVFHVYTSGRDSKLVGVKKSVIKVVKSAKLVIMIHMVVWRLCFGMKENLITR